MRCYDSDDCPPLRKFFFLRPPPSGAVVWHSSERSVAALTVVTRAALGQQRWCVSLHGVALRSEECRPVVRGMMRRPMVEVLVFGGIAFMQQVCFVLQHLLFHSCFLHA